MSGGHTCAVPIAMATGTTGGDLGTAILQRHLGSPAGHLAADVQPDAGQTAFPGQDVPLPVRLFSRAAVQRAEAFSGIVRSEGEPSLMRLEMPLLRMVERRTGKAEAGSAMLVQTWPASPGAPTTLPLRRATADTSATVPASESPGAAPPQSAGEPSAPTETRPGLEGLDLERLADEVYAIIERRLTIERESLGL